MKNYLVVSRVKAWTRFMGSLLYPPGHHNGLRFFYSLVAERLAVGLPTLSCAVVDGKRLRRVAHRRRPVSIVRLETLRTFWNLKRLLNDQSMRL